VIYGYAGADPDFLINFDDYFPGAADHPLEVNYRCPPIVVDGARTLLALNRRRVTKVMRAGREPDDAPVLFLEVEVTDPSEFSTELCIRGIDVEGYQVLRVESSVK